MTPQKHDLDPFTAGDHFPGIPLIRVREDGVPPATYLDSVRLRFQADDRRVVPAVELSTGETEITANGGAWEITVPLQAVPGLTAGKWRYNLETTDDTGLVSTPMFGQIRVRGPHDPEPSHFTLETITAGDHFPGIPQVLITVNGETPETTVGVAEFTFHQVGKPAVVLSSDAEKITIGAPILYRSAAAGPPVWLPSSISISGALTSNGSTPVVFMDLALWRTNGGKSDFTVGGTYPAPDGHAYWNLDKWVLGRTNSGPYWESTAAVAAPHLVPSGAWHATDNPHAWRPISPATGTPVLTGSFIGEPPVTGQNCRVGDSDPYSWYQFNGTAWDLMQTAPSPEWNISIPAQAVPGLTAGKWLAKLRTQDSDGVWKTWFSADQTVLPDC